MAKKNRSSKSKSKPAAKKGKPSAAKKATPKPAKKSRPAAKSAKPAAGISAKAHAIESMIFGHDFALKVCAAFPDDKLTHQNHPHDNHPLWTIGHLATAYDWFAGLLDGKPTQISEHYGKLFGYQSQPSPDRSVYPPLDEVLSACDASWQRILAAAKSTSEADLAKPTRSDSMGFANDRLTVIERTTWHDGWHAGQVSAIRRSLGLPSIMGS